MPLPTRLTASAPRIDEKSNASRKGRLRLVEGKNEHPPVRHDEPFGPKTPSRVISPDSAQRNCSLA